jgi:hypothetical protein
MIVYPVLLATVCSLFVASVVGRATAEVSALRNAGPSFITLPDGTIAAQVRLKIENETDEPRRYRIELVGAPDASLRSPLPAWDIAPHAAHEIPLLVEAAADSFAGGSRRVLLRVSDDDAFSRDLPVVLLGPAEPTARPAPDAKGPAK